MIHHISGKLQVLEPTEVVVAAGPVGITLFVTPFCTEGLVVGQEAMFYTHLVVREDDLSLYGFRKPDTRNIFRLLISVNGIGPRMAQRILSVISATDLSAAVADNRLDVLEGIKGIGKKTAQKMLLELHEKMVGLGHIAGEGGAPISANEDAVQALISLGHKRPVAEKAVSKATSELGPEASLEELVRRALKLA